MNVGSRRLRVALWWYVGVLAVIGIATNGEGMADPFPTEVRSEGTTTIPRLTTVPPPVDIVETTTSTSSSTSTTTSTTVATAASTTTIAARATAPTTTGAVATTPPPATAAPTPATESCPNGTYVNVDGNRVCRPYASDTAPSGATARCRDGEYSFSQNRQGTCSGHGGVAVWL